MAGESTGAYVIKWNYNSSVEGKWDDHGITDNLGTSYCGVWRGVGGRRRTAAGGGDDHGKMMARVDPRH